MTRFTDQTVTFANGSTGTNIEIPTANPSNYHQVISRPDEMRPFTVDGKLFLPPEADAPLPCVIVAPGSLGVAPSHVSHAEAITDLGFAAFVLDSFGTREVTSTVANQTQFSFAASAYDVLATWKVLADRPEIDDTRIGAQGHSRGGTAVLMAATRCLADAVLNGPQGLCAVYAAYPWCGHQFTDPTVGTTRVRSVIGDADQWCAPMQVQAHMHAIRLSGGDASFRLMSGLQHSFDRGAPVTNVPEASVSPNAPTSFIARDGAFIHPLVGTPDPALMDRDLMLYGVKSGFGQRGARIGGSDESALAFREDMTGFWVEVFA